ncbi:MAG: peptidoglycan-binding protein [Candidatus Colwellbacteria bacterium]|nr:peptidoglycan-binding protein [Candidatus Colwellbacteria bacterium]
MVDDNRDLEKSDDSLGTEKRRKVIGKWGIAILVICALVFIISLVAIYNDHSKKEEQAPPSTSAVTTEDASKTEVPTGRLERDLKVGDEGEDVKLLQYKLQQQGFYNGTLSGFFNSGTESALKAYQKAKGIKETGIADIETRSSLNGDSSQVKETVIREVVTNTVVDKKALNDLQKKVDDLTDTNKDLQKKVDDLKDRTGTGDSVTGTSAPTIVSSGASSLGESYASINGTIDPNGLETTYWVDYGIYASSMVQSTHFSAGNGIDAKAVTVSLSGLSPNTTYYYRLRASNSNGDAPVSELRSFITTTSSNSNLNITVGISKFGISSINGDLKVYVEATGIPDSGAKCAIEVQNSSSGQPASSWSNGGEHVYNIPYQTSIYVRAVITYNGQNYYSSWTRYPQ